MTKPAMRGKQRELLYCPLSQRTTKCAEDSARYKSVTS